jgi:eukaryotic-like serine/threonine-protein kinase
MDFFYFVFSKRFFKHFIASVGIFGVIIWIVFLLLSAYTKHGNYINVPRFEGQNIVQVLQDPAFSDFDFVVIDSVFDLKSQKGMILRQDPYPDSKVKTNRKIYLTIVSTNPEKTSMPDLKYLTLRQAVSILESTGLKVGRISYIPTFDQDAVQQQSFGGLVIEPGTRLDKGSVIDLTVGMGSQGEAATGGSQSDSLQNDSTEITNQL